ncbi:calmodulin [Thecamonas trahens ATCC 50062]|uniref:Calmodulin n=1 Tax=Thecamonas trahens ATCC 50062 TaxID=461836 RepID=A0A0L0D3U7_THETB|nr:calmodulin [Thecamonas trahens ATCC 50062]KNC45978.1 calmodulin [Thecamonas trahens ATCC 50062]|eukprot:XP_013762959.1 calmodulin [Thecamonas trahens ATCC 50062]
MEGLTEEQVEELRDGFNSVDADGGGTLTVDEVHKFLHQLGHACTMDEVTTMIKEVDADGNGEIDFDEFCVLMANSMKDADPNEELRWAFSLFDTSKTGTISVDELIDTFMAELGESLATDEAKEMLAAADFDGDGQVNVDDFVKLVSL